MRFLKKACAGIVAACMLMSAGSITSQAKNVSVPVTVQREASIDQNGAIVTGQDDGITAGEIAAAVAATGVNDVHIMTGSISYLATMSGAALSSYVVVLDPGHGGSDPGANYTANGIGVERDLNLKIAQACKAALEKSGVKVYMTRNDNNTYLSLPERAQFAADRSADLFISIHNNFSSNADTHGTEVWIPNNSSYNYYAHTAGESLGTNIISNLVNMGLVNRGVRTRLSDDGSTYSDGVSTDYYGVIRESRKRGVPGIIVEHAFGSNASDAQNFLSTDAKLQALGEADAKGIIAFISGASGKVAQTQPVERHITYGGIDYGAVFDTQYYYNTNGDLKSAYGYDQNKLIAHFVNYGMAEGRVACAEFNVNYYKNRYSDLRDAYGNDLKQYYLHYIKYGVAEHRDGKTYCAAPASSSTSAAAASTTKTSTAVITPPTASKGTTTYNGQDYSAVYSYEYYIAAYPDVKAAFGNDAKAAIQHFVNYGMKEGRQANANFNPVYYKNRYADIRAAYGKDLKSYYMHYITYGRTEGRDAKTPCEMTGGTTVYNGVNYSAVYNYDYYIKRYPDVKAAFGGDEDQTIAHFVNYGMTEGRQGNANFNVMSYAYQYQDLRNVYKNNLKLYYLHYLNYGRAEGRKATGVTTMQNPVVVLNGVNYSSIYDYNYYVSKYPDIRAAYGLDDAATLAHFVNYGMKEGRQAKASFNVSYYKSNYADLQAVYGSDTAAYYTHYLNYGYKENRIGSQLLSAYGTKTDIMGGANTSVAQMAAYYKSRATYPAFYANTDAPTIEAFCQIYIEECTAEGVRADVAFCQAMKETGFLRFGGQVQIEQFNFAGLGATDDGAAGASFSSVRLGIRAQVQHLKAYASKSALKNACVDTRFDKVTRGSAPYVEWLGINENPYGKGWASGKNYGISIVNDYMARLKQY